MTSITPYTQYVSVDEPNIKLVSAIQKSTMINNISYSVTFHITVNAIGSASITESIKYRLRIHLSSSDSKQQDTQIIAEPAMKEGRVLCTYKTKAGVVGSAQNTVDKNNIYPLEWIHGDLYFEIPKRPDQYPVSQFVEFG